jgi:hypothetical protein
VVIEIDNEEPWIIPPSGVVARMIPAEPEDYVFLNGVPLVTPTKYNGVIGLPEEPDQNLYIVSAIVGHNVPIDHPLKGQLIGPDTNTRIRDETGKFVAVRGFVKF